MEDKVITTFEIMLNAATKLPWKVIMAWVVLFGLGVGLFLILQPDAAIRIQTKVYAKINWRMTPICLKKEIRNTRLMGIFLCFSLLLILLFVALAKRAFF